MFSCFSQAQPELAISPLLVSPAFRAEEEPHERHRERTLLTTSYSAAPAENSWREPPVTERNRRRACSEKPHRGLGATVMGCNCDVNCDSGGLLEEIIAAHRSHRVGEAESWASG